MQKMDELLSTGVYETITPDREMTVADLLKELNLEDKYFGILVNGKKAELIQRIGEKDSIVILPHIAGGF